MAKENFRATWRTVLAGSQSLEGRTLAGYR